LLVILYLPLWACKKVKETIIVSYPSLSGHVLVGGEDKEKK
jgi:hypothetical protein